MAPMPAPGLAVEAEAVAEAVALVAEAVVALVAEAAVA
jgi:hypothetical protein